MPPAFEVYYQGSWQPTEWIGIVHGHIVMQLQQNDSEIQEKIVLQSLRLKSRKASSSDCRSFLKPGTDVCVFTTYKNPDPTSSDQKDRKSAWHDAKIISVLSKSHEHQCHCRFFVSFYLTYDPRGRNKGTLGIDIREVSIDDIFILQKLIQKPSRDGSGQLSRISDCQLVAKNRIFGRTFSSKMAWLTVLSIVNGLDFEINVIQNKLQYIISNNGEGTNVVEFESCNGLLKPKLQKVVLACSEIIVAKDAIAEEGPLVGSFENESNEDLYQFIDIRRSKRPRVPPDRFLSYGNLPGAKGRPVKNGRQNNREMLLEHESPIRNSLLAYSSMDEFHDDFHMIEFESRTMQKQIGLNIFQENDSILQFGSEIKDASHLPKRKKRHEGCYDGFIGQGMTCHKKVLLDEDNLSTEITSHIQSTWKTVGDHGGQSESNVPGKKLHKGSYGKPQSKNDSVYSSSKTFYGQRTGRQRTPKVTDLKQMLEICMKNIEFEKDKWKQNQKSETNEAKYESHLKFDFDGTSDLKECESSSEYQDLWKQMENSLFEINSHATRQDPDVDSSNSASNDRGKPDAEICSHEYRLDEKVGFVCHLCGTLGIDIRNVMPPFIGKKTFASCKDELVGYKMVLSEKYDFCSDILTSTFISTDLHKSDDCDNVWSMVPDYKRKFHTHQKQAFEFLWKNISGSLNPREMDQTSVNTGGCVLSHSPGSGKTLTVISFLASYLKAFPGKRPLIIVPKITLLVWCNEFKKWDFPFPVYQIHVQRSFRTGLSDYRSELFGWTKLNRETKHLVDCLDKVYKWHKGPSVLLLSYSSFVSLTKKRDVNKTRGLNLERILQQSPGILVLDEGHNPRSTKSKLRKSLMEVKTELRILLSGTLFQNNFVEYFNTLCLARPKFISDLMGGSKQSLHLKGKKKSRIQLERRARKFFVDNIAKRIESKVEMERKLGLEMLNKLTSGFVHVYNGTGASDRLPGLQRYTIFVKSTNIQDNFLSKLHGAKIHNRSSFELEILITIGSIHPWLLRTVSCARKYFTVEELKSLEEYKLDITRGTKVTFIVNLVRHCVAGREKVLIFSHNISPINYLVEIFEHIFGWQRNKEVLVLQGEQELPERALVMDKFKENGGPAQVLVASTTACAEGISLTAASRVILLDSEWNPAKTNQAIARAFRPGQKKMVYVYCLFASGTLEEDKYGKTAFKELQSKLIFTGSHLENSTDTNPENIDDAVLRRLVEREGSETFEMIMKHEKIIDNVGKGGPV